MSFETRYLIARQIVMEGFINWVLVAPRWITMIAAVLTTLIIALNIKLLFDFVTG